MKNLFILAIFLMIFSGCSYSQNMMNREGEGIRCWASGWGFIGGPMAINTFNDCINAHKQIGYVEIEQVGVPGLYLNEGNPPSIREAPASQPAGKAGMMAGDKIMFVNGQPVKSIKDVAFFGFCKPGDTINYQIDRNGEVKLFTITAIHR